MSAFTDRRDRQRKRAALDFLRSRPGEAFTPFRLGQAARYRDRLSRFCLGLPFLRVWRKSANDRYRPMTEVGHWPPTTSFS